MFGINFEVMLRKRKQLKSRMMPHQFSNGSSGRQYVQVWKLTTMHESVRSYHYSKIMVATLRLELKFTDFFVLGERMTSVTVDKFVVFGSFYQNAKCCSSTIIQSYPLTQLSNNSRRNIFQLLPRRFPQ